MKRIGISLSAILLSTLIVLGSCQIIIGKMICSSGKMSNYSFGNAKDCCEKKGSVTESLESSCCKLINVFYSLNDFSSSQKVNVSAVEFNFFSSATAFVLQLPSTNLHFTLKDLPPPDTKELLFEFRSLLL